MKYQTLFFLACLIGVYCNAQKIIDKPIIFNKQRKELTLKYLKDRYGLDQEKPTIHPKIIVLHWTAIPTFKASFDAFVNPKLPNFREEIAGASSLNVSAQFLVDRDGKIYRLMPENFMARHVIGLNYAAIGVENVGGTQETPLTRAQLKANIWLVTYLSKKYEIKYVIGHYEYQNFEGTPLWLEKDDHYRTSKIDPGTEFMTKVRKAVNYLDLKAAPSKK